MYMAQKGSALVVILLMATTVAVAAAGITYFGFRLGKIPASTTPASSPTATLQPKDDLVCIQVISYAKDPETNECKEFPNPCVVPEGWEKVGGCNGNGKSFNDLRIIK